MVTVDSTVKNEILRSEKLRLRLISAQLWPLTLLIHFSHIYKLAPVSSFRLPNKSKRWRNTGCIFLSIIFQIHSIELSIALRPVQHVCGPLGNL